MSATIKCMVLCGYAGALKSTVEAHSAPKGSFIHSAQRNVSNPEADALKGCINQKAKESHKWSVECRQIGGEMEVKSSPFLHCSLSLISETSKAKSS